MILPADYLWLEPVLIAAVIVFFVDLIGNMVTFRNRIANALATAIIFAIIFGVLAYYGYGDISVSLSTTPAADAPATSGTTPPPAQ